MKKSADYKKLLIPSVIYAVSGSLQIYLGEALTVFGEIDAEEDGLDAIFSDYTFYGYLLMLFNFLGVFTLVFWSICFFIYRKENINRNPKAWIIPGVSVCLYSFIGSVLAVNENFIPLIQIEFNLSGLYLYIEKLLPQAIPFYILLILYACIPKRRKVKRGE